MVQHSHGKLVLLIGPSGVGKSVILRALMERHPEVHIPRSATTRARRPREDDHLYRFVTEEAFDALIEDGAMIEWAVVHGGARYGTLVEEIIPFIENGDVVLREVDVQGFDSIRSHRYFRDGGSYALESVFILPQSKEQLIERIKNRAPISADELERRVASMEQELTYAHLCDYQIVNREGALSSTVKEIEKALGLFKPLR
ncbi:guanylate kinase [Candidatus Peregrinibacteria bacterium CG10_big_fil_rev_8_21_14_0_10_55_24]|nr:MAG: guanylate kinase [Candidatus Peregrinibacteria bacterium CG10_big_fil_rev_8_21_14_0_10_55_24]